jgi:hypothetical protein
MTSQYDAQKSEGRTETRTAGRADLDRQYRRIGISAVVAALPYKGDAKNPAYAPAVSKDDVCCEAA